MASTITFRQIGLEVLSAKTNPYNPHYGEHFASALQPLIKDEQELDSRRVQSASIGVLANDLVIRQDEIERETQGA